MLKRIGYALWQTGRSRKCLLRFQQPIHQCAQITDLSEATLKASGVRILVLDFDGVLAPYGAVHVLPAVDIWIKQLQLPVYILSNKPFSERLAALKHYSHVHCITGVRKKPYPDGLEAVIKETQVKPDEIVLVDDRLLTGMLAVCVAGCQGILVSKPYIDYRTHLFIESGFTLLRTLERWGLKLYSFFK